MEAQEFLPKHSKWCVHWQTEIVQFLPISLVSCLDSSGGEHTAFFILEDDAQNGADHVDAHRSIALVVSKYAPRGSTPFVDCRFYSTVSVVRTMESLLGLPPMNNNDAFTSLSPRSSPAPAISRPLTPTIPTATTA